MGVVYLAEQQNPRRKVAIKIVAPDPDIPPAFLEALKKEGDIAAGFEHDNLAHVYECGIVDDHYYLAMQYLAGGDLDHQLALGLSLEQVRDLIRAIASALHHIHGRGFIHRDIKPANILFTEAGKPVLADFGIAKAADSVGVLTTAGYSTGTPAYMSPEQILGQDVDGRSDLYALGIVLYQCLSGILPFQAGSEHELKHQQVTERPPPLSGETAAFQPIIDGLLAKKPADRFADGAALVHALDALPPLQGRSAEPGAATPGAHASSASSPVTVWVREMGQRRVFRVLAVYVALGWGLTEIVAGVLENLNAPNWPAAALTVAFVVGLPVVVALAWLYDIGPGGVRKTPTRRKGLFLVSIALATVASLTWLVLRYVPTDGLESPDDTSAAETSSVVMAVMPFANLSPVGADAYLEEVLAENLLNDVALIPTIRVKATASSFSLKGATPQEISAKLGVNRILDGTFVTSEQGVRISTRLIDANSGDILWTESFRDELENIFVLQEQAARAIAGRLGLVHPSEDDQTRRRINAEAFRLYHEAVDGFVNPFTDTESSIEKTLRALQLEADFPEALAWLGGLYTSRAWIAQDRQAPELVTAVEYLHRAMELAPKLPEAYAYMGLNLAIRYRWTEARPMLDRAVELLGQRPLPLGLTAGYNNLGHRRISLELEQGQFDRDPLNPRSYRGLLGTLVHFHQDQRALQVARLADEQGIPIRREALIPALARTGALEEARQLSEFPPPLADAQIEAIRTGRSETMEAALDQMLAAGDWPLGDVLYGMMIAGAHQDKVFELADRAWAEGKLNQIAFFKRGMERYRNDPRFLPLMDAMGLLGYWRNVEPPDFCEFDSVVAVCP
jgi:TolB-like protein